MSLVGVDGAVSVVLAVFDFEGTGAVLLRGSLALTSWFRLVLEVRADLVPEIGVEGWVGSLAGGLAVMGLRTVGVLVAENEVILIGGSGFLGVDDRVLGSKEFLLGATPGLVTVGVFAEVDGAVLEVRDLAAEGVVVPDEGLVVDLDGLDVCLPNMAFQ